MFIFFSPECFSGREVGNFINIFLKVFLAKIPIAACVKALSKRVDDISFFHFQHHLKHNDKFIFIVLQISERNLLRDRKLQRNMLYLVR